jgi:hypothetical protein
LAKEKEDLYHQHELLAADQESLRFEREEFTLQKSAFDRQTYRLKELEIQNEVLHLALQELSAKSVDLLRDQDT